MKPDTLASGETFISQGKRNRWLDDATRDIHCKTDRTAVRQELFNHIADRSESYRAQGLNEAEALSRAVDDMGDARALRPQLAQLHRPFWGRAHFTARLAAILLLLCVLSPFNKDNLDFLTGMDTSMNLGGVTSSELEADTLASPPAPPRGQRTTYGSSVDTIAEYTISGKVRSAGHTLSLPAAWVEQQIYYDKNGQPTTISNTLVLYIKASTPLLWGQALPRQEMVAQHILTDSDGVRYSDRRFQEKVERVAICTPYEGRLGVTWYRLRLGLGNHETPEQVDIPIGGGDLVLHVDLKKGAIT